MLVLGGALSSPRRYGLLLGLIGVVLLSHSLQSHKEYRFVFCRDTAVAALGADLTVRPAAMMSRRRADRPNAARLALGSAAFLFALVSLAGVLNALPAQDRVYQAWSQESGFTGFVRGQDPIFAAYRHLAGAPSVTGVWQVDRPYFQLPGYYYLHRSIPFYDAFTGRWSSGLGDGWRLRQPPGVPPTEGLRFQAIRWSGTSAACGSCAGGGRARWSASGTATLRSSSTT